MKSILRNYIIDAILLLVLGVVLLVRPGGTLHFICTIFGIFLIVMGVVKEILYFSAQREKNNPDWDRNRYQSKERGITSLLVGIVQVIFGILLLAMPKFFIGIIPLVAGIIIGYGALVSLIRAIRLSKYHIPGVKAALILSVITLVLAVLVILHPAFISEVIVQTIGISLIIEAVTLLVALSRK